jgi:hypothetical protein
MRPLVVSGLDAGAEEQKPGHPLQRAAPETVKVVRQPPTEW